MLKIRQSRDNVIFNMGIPIPGKDGLYIESGPMCVIETSELGTGWSICTYRCDKQRVLMHRHQG